MSEVTEMDQERTLALKGSIRLLAEQADRKKEECAELADFAIDLVDRVLENGHASAS
jgi:hypothetical protein